jgi:uncharacterized protein (TIGR00255 family)
MIRSMTAFATTSGRDADHIWTWELRGVNGKGLDLRLRLPDWIPGLEQAVRTAVQGRVARGSLTVSLKIAREAGAAAMALDTSALEAALRLIKHVESAANEHNLHLSAPNAADVLAIRGVVDASAADIDCEQLLAALRSDLDLLLEDFQSMRSFEGDALAAILSDQLDSVAALTEAALAEAEARQEHIAQTLRANLARILENAEGADPDRVAQELALIAVKTDVREELDRLGAHVGAARALLNADGPVGRKLDFLMQEFNREANTLCSKAQSTALTRIGLDLKSVIDQMREQVQNVE